MLGQGQLFQQDLWGKQCRRFVVARNFSNAAMRFSLVPSRQGTPVFEAEESIGGLSVPNGWKSPCWTLPFLSFRFEIVVNSFTWAENTHWSQVDWEMVLSVLKEKRKQIGSLRERETNFKETETHSRVCECVCMCVWVRVKCTQVWCFRTQFWFAFLVAWESLRRLETSLGVLQASNLGGNLAVKAFSPAKKPNAGGSCFIRSSFVQREFLLNERNFESVAE